MLLFACVYQLRVHFISAPDQQKAELVAGRQFGKGAIVGEAKTQPIKGSPIYAFVDDSNAAHPTRFRVAVQDA